MSNNKFIVKDDKGILHIEGCPKIIGDAKKIRGNLQKFIYCKQCEKKILFLQGDKNALKDIDKYNIFFKDIPIKIIRKFYMNGAKTKWYGNMFFITYKNDDWKIIDDNILPLELWHNNYAIKNGKRIAKSGYHLQATIKKTRKAFLNTIMWYKSDCHVKKHT